MYCHSVKALIEHFGPDYWRKRANEARSLAFHSSDAKSKRVMNGIADDYERMATTAERLEASRNVLGKSSQGTE